MKANYDQENDILYIVVKDGAAFDSKELEDDLRVEYDQKGDIKNPVYDIYVWKDGKSVHGAK